MTLPLPRALLPRTLQELGNDRIDSFPLVSRRQALDGGFLACVGGNRHALGIGEQFKDRSHAPDFGAWSGGCVAGEKTP